MICAHCQENTATGHKIGLLQIECCYRCRRAYHNLAETLRQQFVKELRKAEDTFFCLTVENKEPSRPSENPDTLSQFSASSPLHEIELEDDSLAEAVDFLS